MGPGTAQGGAPSGTKHRFVHTPWDPPAAPERYLNQTFW